MAGPRFANKKFDLPIQAIEIVAAAFVRLGANPGEFIDGPQLDIGIVDLSGIQQGSPQHVGAEHRLHHLPNLRVGAFGFIDLRRDDAKKVIAPRSKAMLFQHFKHFDNHAQKVRGGRKIHSGWWRRDEKGVRSPKDREGDHPQGWRRVQKNDVIVLRQPLNAQTKAVQRVRVASQPRGGFIFRLVQSKIRGDQIDAWPGSSAEAIPKVGLAAMA